MKKIIVTLVVVAVLAGVGYGLAKVRGNGQQAAFELIPVERGDLVEKALATGQIVPHQEIQVKSQISGIIKEAFAEVGDRVRVGEPLFTISPDSTPLQLTEAERDLERAQVGHQKARADLERAQTLFDRGLVSQQELESARRLHDEARIQVDLTSERLMLLREGRIVRERGGVDSVIRAPASGTVLERLVNPGDPVVPLTTFQAGTPLMTIADMGSLLFKGTVDEIDVGKLREGLPARIKVGALPDAVVEGRLERLAPKAREKEGSTLFDVEVSLLDSGDAVLRAGYSANADVIIRERTDTLVIPERLVRFEGEETYVEVPGPDPEGEPVKRPIEIGLSDGLRVEVLAGLDEGDRVVERSARRIGGR